LQNSKSLNAKENERESAVYQNFILYLFKMETAKIIIPYFLSAITLYNMFLAGNKNKRAWLV
jgi:hypothetical protein